MEHSFLRRSGFLCALILLQLPAFPASYAAVTSSVIVPATKPSATSSATPSAAQGPVQVQDVRGQTIFFSGTGAPKTVKTGLFELNYVATLKPHDGSMPYFLFAANPCGDCSLERALYLIRPVVHGKPQITQFVYPGRILDPHTRSMVLQSRAFYGRCLPPSRAYNNNDAGDDVYVVFQQERVTQRHRRTRLLSSVYVAHASSDFLRDKLIERRLPSLKRTLALVRARKCHEIDGRYRLMELKPRGLDWRNLQPDNPDDDQDRDDGSGNTAPGDPASD